MQGSHSPLSSSPSPRLQSRLSTLLGALALAGSGLIGLQVALAGDPPPADPADLAIPISGSNIYGIPGERPVEIWTGHLGGDCQPKLLTTAQLIDPHCAIQTSDDGSTLAYLTSSGVSFERQDGFKMSRARLEGGYQPGVAGAAELVLSPSGRRAAYVTHEGASDLLRTTLWTLDLGAGTSPGPLPSETVKPARLKRSAPGVQVLPVGWTPSGQSLIYLELTPVRGSFVSHLVVRDVRAQTESVIARSLQRIDFALPFQTGAGTGGYGVLVGDAERVRWVYPQGSPDELLRSPSGAPLIGRGIKMIEANPKQPRDLAILLAWPTPEADGRLQSGAYRVRGDRTTQLTSERGLTSIGYGPQGTLSLTDSNWVWLLRWKSDATLAFADSDENPLRIRSNDWHASQALFALALDDAVVILDLSGKLRDDAQRRSGWAQFVGLRAPGQPKPTLHRAYRLEAGSEQRITSVLWHGDRLVWTLEQTSQAGLIR